MLLNSRYLFLFLFFPFSWALSSCSSPSPPFPCLCDVPPPPNLPSHEALRQEVQQEDALAKQRAALP